MRKIVVAGLFLIVGACATTASGPQWNDETVSQLSVGATRSDVIGMFGQPASRSTNNNIETLVYRRPSDEASGSNAYLSVMTFGMRSGENAVRVDALRIEITDGVVSNFEYSENIDNNFGNAGLN